MPGFRLSKALGLEAPKSKFRDTQAAVLPRMQARQPLYRGIQQRGTAQVGQFHPQQVQTGQQLVDYYKAGPDAAGLNASNATALRTQDNGYLQAGARLRALGARTGADTSGAQATLESSRVAGAFPIQQSMTARRLGEIERFKRGAMLTTGQLAGQGAATEAQGLQGGQALDGQIFGTAGQLAQIEEARRQATLQRILAFAQQAGQLAGGAYGGGGGGRGVAQPQGMAQTDYYDPGNGMLGDGYDYSYYPGRY
jgi:hypothetical protein